MAIYHCSVQVIGRNKGKSSVAATAYRSGEFLVNEYDGVPHDFTKKNWVEFSEIILPENAPREYSDRSTLWNAVETYEKSKDAQLCREFEIALPKEFSREQQIEVVEKFVKDKLVSQGMIADIAIHNKPDMNDWNQPVDKYGNPTNDINSMQFINPHAHILVTMRPMDKNGKWLAKTQKEYICIKDGEEKGFTAEEFKKAKEDGWEKQYKYYEGKKKIWLTAKEAKERGLERVNRSPKTTPFGRKNELVEYWTSKDRIFEWRQYWEKVVNDKFESLNSEIRIDCRSFKDQGLIEELPTLHMGPAATNMERRAERELREGKAESEVIHSDIGNINRQIRKHNRFVREIKAKLKSVFDTAKTYIDNLARKLGDIRSRIIGNKYEESVLSQKLDMMSQQLSKDNELLEKYNIEISKVGKSNEADGNKIKVLKNELDSCTPLQFIRKNQLHRQILELQEHIEIRKDYIRSLSRMFGYKSDGEYQVAKKDYLTRYDAYKKLENSLNLLQEYTQQLTQSYHSEINNISPESDRELLEAIRSRNTEAEADIFSALNKKYGSAFDPNMFSEAKLSTGNNLDMDKTAESKHFESDSIFMNHDNDGIKHSVPKKPHHKK